HACWEKVRLKSSIHQPTPPTVSPVPSLKRKRTVWLVYASRLPDTCTQPPLPPLHARLPASGFWVGQLTRVWVYPPDVMGASAQAPPSTDSSSTPPSQPVVPEASRLYRCQKVNVADVAFHGTAMGPLVRVWSDRESTSGAKPE